MERVTMIFSLLSALMLGVTSAVSYSLFFADHRPSIIIFSMKCFSGSSGGCGGGCKARARAAGRLVSFYETEEKKRNNFQSGDRLPSGYVYGMGIWTDEDPLRNATLVQLTVISKGNLKIRIEHLRC